MDAIDRVENLIRDHLAGTDRSVTKKSMSLLVESVGYAQYLDIVWDRLVEDGYLIKVFKKDRDTGKPLYKWEL